MSMHPELTTTVYIIIAVVFLAFMVGLFFYTRRIDVNKTTAAEKGRLPVDKEEGILLATRENEKRPGPPAV